MKQTIHIKQSELKNIITESVKNTLKEHFNTIKDIKDIHKTSKMHKYKNKYDDDDNEQEDDELEKMTY